MKKILRLKLPLLIIATLLLSTLMSCASAAAPERKLTIMVYMTGSDLESGYGAATNDITEMLRAHTDAENVNLIVMTGGSHKWWGGFPSDRTVIHEISGRRPTEVWSSDVMNMADADTLATFINYGYANYPAEDYALILWDHGGGPLMGVCADELHVNNGVTDMLDMVELQTALSMSPCASQPLEWIGFDACLMSSIETACMCAPYAEYMIASQEVEPGSGWNYAFLSGIAADPDGAATGTRIADAYIESFGPSANMYPLTLACIDLSKVYDVETALDNMFSSINGVLDESSFSVLSNKRRDTRALGRASTGSEYDLVDLYNLTQQYADQAPEAAAQLMTAIDEAVICHRTNIENTNGLSVYYPYFNKDYYTYLWEAEYSRLFFAPGYTNYLRSFASIWLGESMSSWAGLKANTLAPIPEEEDMTTLTMELTDDQLANFSGAEMYVMSHDATLDHYSFVYSTDDVTLDGNTLTARYNNRALYVVDENGEPLTGSLEYHVTEDTYLLRAVLMEGEHELDGETMPVYLQLKPVEGTDELQVIGVIDLTQQLGLNSGKQNASLDPEVWHTISIIRYPSYATYDENGQILPFSQWEDSSWIFADYFSTDQEWSIRFVEENFNTDQFAAMITVTDTQGNEYASDLTAIPNHNLEQFPIEPCVIADNEFIKIELIDAYYSLAAYDPGLRFHMRTTNKTDKSINTNTQHYIVDGLVLNTTARITDDLEAGATIDTMMDIPAYKLYEHNITTMDSISFEITVSDDNLDTLCKVEASLPGNIDLAPIIPSAPTTGAPVTVPEAGVMNIELFDVTDNGDGTFGGWLRYVNNSGADYDTHITDAIINNHAVPDFLTLPLWLPDGATYYRYVTLSSEGEYSTLYLDDLPQLTDPCAYWGLDTIETLSLKLTDKNYDSAYVDVTLPGPIAFARDAEPVSTMPLYEDEHISVSIREAIADLDYGRAGLVLHVVNKTDAPQILGFDTATLNGASVYASGSTDTSIIGSLNYGHAELKPGLTERLIILFNATDLGDDPAIETISFCMYFGPSEDDLTYTDPITVTLPAGLTFTTFPADGVGHEEMTVTEVAFAGVMEPSDLIVDKIAAPENPGDYLRTISAQLTGEQAASFMNGQLIIIQKFADPDGGEIFRIITAADSLTLGDDGTVTGEYSGLMLTPANSPESIITTIEKSHAPDNIDISSGYITIRDANYQLDRIDLNNILITGKGPEADVTGVSSENASIRSYTYSQMEHWYYDVVPAYDANGVLIHYSDMAYPDFSAACECTFENGALELQLRPANADDQLYALFAINCKDGSGFCLEPIPLD